MDSHGKLVFLPWIFHDEWNFFFSKNLRFLEGGGLGLLPGSYRQCKQTPTEVKNVFLSMNPTSWSACAHALVWIIYWDVLSVCVCVCVCVARGSGLDTVFSGYLKSFVGPTRVAKHHLGSALGSTISHCHSNIEADHTCPQTRYHKQ